MILRILETAELVHTNFLNWTMRYFFLVVFLLTSAVSFSQDMHIEPLEGFQNDCLTCQEAFSIGNGYTILYCEHDVFISNPLGECLNFSNYVIIDEITAAIWMDMNGDQELDLILETYYRNGRSGWQGGHGEEVRSMSIIDVTNSMLLFSWDYYFHIEYWENEVDWSDEENPEIIDGSGGSSTYHYSLAYAEGVVMGNLVLNESTGDEEEAEILPAQHLFAWKGEEFQEMRLIQSKNINQ